MAGDERRIRDGNEMYICHCRAVTDRRIRQEVAAGARTVDDLGFRCGAGSGCGGCWPALVELLSQLEFETDHRRLGTSVGLPGPAVAAR